MIKIPPIPTRLREFVKETTLEEDDEHVLTTVKLRCPRCGGTKFVLHWQHLLEAGKVIETSPVWIACGSCRYYALLFDRRSDGVDGLENRRPIEIPDCKVKAYSRTGLASYGVEVVVQYDKDDSELFGADGEIIPDVFHWLSILVEQPDGSMDGAIDFETA
jgi:hypothetical protein